VDFLGEGEIVMTAEKIDPAAVLAFLEAKIAALQAVANSWKKALELGALGPIGLPRTTGNTVTDMDSQQTEEPVELPAGALSKLSVSDAVKLYLSAAKKKQTNKQIEAGLKDGGVESTAKNFSSIVNGALKRLKDTGVLLRFKEGWGLAENYPEHLRAKIAQQSKQINTSKGRKKKSKGRARAAEKQGVPQPEGLGHHIESTDQPQKPTRKEVVLKFLAMNGPSTRAVITEGTGIPDGSVGASLNDHALFVRGEDHKWRNIE
jgi:hypothetical protein